MAYKMIVGRSAIFKMADRPTINLYGGAGLFLAEGQNPSIIFRRIPSIIGYNDVICRAPKGMLFASRCQRNIKGKNPHAGTLASLLSDAIFVSATFLTILLSMDYEADCLTTCVYVSSRGFPHTL